MNRKNLIAIVLYLSLFQISHATEKSVVFYENIAILQEFQASSKLSLHLHTFEVPEPTQLQFDFFNAITPQDSPKYKRSLTLSSVNPNDIVQVLTAMNESPQENLDQKILDSLNNIESLLMDEEKQKIEYLKKCFDFFYRECQKDYSKKYTMDLFLSILSLMNNKKTLFHIKLSNYFIPPNNADILRKVSVPKLEI